MKRLLLPGLTIALASSLAALSVPADAVTTGGHAAAGQVTHSSAKPRPGTRVAGPRGAAVRSAQRLVASRPAVLKAGRYDRFHAGQVYSSHGLQYVAYERTYRGVPVVGGDFVVATDSRGNVLTTSVAQTRKVALASLATKVTRAQARRTSARRVSAPRLGATRLVVLQRTGSQLAWETPVNGRRRGEASRLSVYVSARTGRVLMTKEHVVEGTGNSAYAGSVPLATSGSGSSYSMTNANASSLVCQNVSGNSTFTGTDDLWGNGDATNRETGCVDAFYAAEQERQMLSAWDGRNGMNGSGGWVPIRVGLNDVNAYYDGTQVQIGHTQTGTKWIGSIDVVAHEFGHGVDDKTPGGISGNGTQEFVADTFGAATEAYANNAVDKPDYLVGEQINLVGNGPIRNMYNPSAVGDANCYSSSTPSSEVHSAAGPGNHWFYLVAEGTNPTNGQPTSPTCNSSTITGLGIVNAEKIMYNAMLLKTTSSSYLKYRTWTLTAAKNLFSGSCTQFNTVKAAWDAVSVPAQAADPTCSTQSNTVTVTSPGNQTGTVGTAKSVQITASDSATGQTLTYSATGLPPGESINTSTGLISGTPTTTGTYSVTVTAKDTTNATGSTTFTWTIGTGGGTGCASPGQKLGNPGFETGTAAPWTASSGVVDNATSQPARTGAWKAWLDGYGSTHTDNLTQSVSIPAGCSATLSFYLHIDTKETTTSTAYDKLTVKAGSTTLATYSNLNKAAGYTLRSFNVSSLAGQTVTIGFSGVEDSSAATNFVIDDTALTVS